MGFIQGVQLRHMVIRSTQPSVQQSLTYVPTSLKMFGRCLEYHLHPSCSWYALQCIANYEDPYSFGALQSEGKHFDIEKDTLLYNEYQARSIKIYWGEKS